MGSGHEKGNGQGMRIGNRGREWGQGMGLVKWDREQGITQGNGKGMGTTHAHRQCTQGLRQGMSI